MAQLVFAHGGESGVGWTFDMAVTIPLIAALALFCAGYVRLRQRAGRSPLASGQVALFIGGWVVLSAALVSPLHRAGERSFALHMTEHELLMLVAAPLLVAARVHGVLLWALPHTPRLALVHFFRLRGVAGTWQALRDPFLATALQATALCVWHAPALFDFALRWDSWHIAQHLSFFVTALLFWGAMLDPHLRLARPIVIVGCLFVTALVSGALGALMAFSTSPWYAGYRALQLDAFGLTPVQDQQIAGLLMWIPGGLVHMAMALALLARALQQMERGDTH